MLSAPNTMTLPPNNLQMLTLRQSWLSIEKSDCDLAETISEDKDERYQFILIGTIPVVQAEKMQTDIIQD